MLEIKDKSKCSGCYACANICPKDCLKMEFDDEGFWYPNIDTEVCIDCGMCEKVCPIIQKDKNIDKSESKFLKEVFAGQSLNKRVRYESSSGGVFSLLAEYIIENKGIVVGVSFDQNLKVIHKVIENKDELYKLRKSKYVQSEVGMVFRKVEAYLKNNKMVLFTGTPCQISGLKSYLRRDYVNLITQDIICHGVPSPILWNTYLEFSSNRYKKEIKDASFRCKKEGWRNFSLNFICADGKKYKKSIEEDFYLIAFQNNISLRPSCYKCSFKGENRKSDITLADFWGIENTNLNLDDNIGTSLIIINSEKGKKVFESIKNKVKLEKSNIEVGTKSNKNYFISAKLNNDREKFLKEINKNNFDKKVRQYCNYGYKVQMMKRIKKEFKKILIVLKLRSY